MRALLRALTLPMLQLEGQTLNDRPYESSQPGKKLEQDKNTVQVAFLGTPLYEEPDEVSAKLAYLNKGTLLNVIGEDGEFLHVMVAGGAAGYVRRTAGLFRYGGVR